MVRFDNFPKRIPPEGDQRVLIDKIFERHILRTHVPIEPLLSASARVISIGSCFAEEISKSLTMEGIDAQHIEMSERWNSAFAVRHLLQKVIHGIPFPPGFITDDEQLARVPEGLRDDLVRVDLVVLTFGLSLCWHERASGRLVLEPPIENQGGGLLIVKLDGYELRQTLVAENESAISACIDLIREVNPQIKIVITLSPVPMAATTIESSIIVANTVSKSMLRAAIHGVMDQRYEGVFYWPSYECVTWLGNHVMPSFGVDAIDMRHVRPDLIQQIAKLFKRYYFYSSPDGAG